jgi:hypothetical protein
MWCEQVHKALLMGFLQPPAFGRFRLISQGITDSEDKLDVEMLISQDLGTGLELRS